MLSHCSEGTRPRLRTPIIRQVFPRTVDAAQEEGADRIFRKAVVEAVKDIIAVRVNPEQSDFRDIDQAFAVIARDLRKSHYYVEIDIEQYKSVRELIDNPPWLDSARKLMRRKGEECLAE